MTTINEATGLFDLELKEALDIVERCKPLLIGEHGAVQGAALGVLVSIWISSQSPTVRETLIARHTNIIRSLSKMMTARLDPPAGTLTN